MKEILQLRFLILKWIREFFYEKNFTEVDTPILSIMPGVEPYLEPFRTIFHLPSGAKRIYYLPYSPELHMKKLLCLGFDKIFQIAHCFRNNELSKLHKPEFLMLEWYRVNSNYNDLMKDIENLIIFLLNKIKTKEVSKPTDIIFSAPWKRITIKELFFNFLNIDLEKCQDANIFYSLLKERKIHIDESFSNDWNTLFFYAFLNEIEPKLSKTEPIFLIDYPICISALAKEKEDNKFYAERFELFIKGIEIANGCTELTNYKEHIKRFNECNWERRKLRKKTYPADKDFFKYIKKGLIPSAGVALGIDRLIMVLLDYPDILNISLR